MPNPKSRTNSNPGNVSRKVISRSRRSTGAAAKRDPAPTPQRLTQMGWGFAPIIILDAAVEVGLFDALAEGPLKLEEVAKATGASVRGLRALLDALVGLEFLTRKAGGYALAPESAAFLVSNRPGYHGLYLRHIAEQVLPHWLRLAEAVRKGRPVLAVNRQSEGQEFFASFVEGLFPLGYRAAQVLGESLGIPTAKQPISVLDLAAGSGVWGIALAQQSPQVRIRAVDWPRVLKVTKQIAARHGVADRLETVPGDLLEAKFGSNHDLVILGHILHSEGARRGQELIQRAFDALAPGGTIVIAEFVANEDRSGPPIPLMFAVNMLIHTTEGDVFTFKQISQWLKDASFKKIRNLETPAPSPLILAQRPA